MEYVLQVQLWSFGWLLWLCGGGLWQENISEGARNVQFWRAFRAAFPSIHSTTKHLTLNSTLILPPPIPPPPPSKASSRHITVGYKTFTVTTAGGCSSKATTAASRYLKVDKCALEVIIITGFAVDCEISPPPLILSTLSLVACMPKCHITISKTYHV